ncbi:arabinosylfuranosidase ArfA [Roseateles oligotrophus]|uniref:non-reducing end alpha-L-arabinofuranosidase n=1 Tax=Roseateles oligotrophus TaxID=1769250 RepID=A0ABT2YHT3_9BURK|nr:alpha-N-arabinofuranosidase [Roseateles oligotrophus]MCV2369614.1 alpha-N-arabinofuranosidase [Roseateles oligotrophus]
MIEAHLTVDRDFEIGPLDRRLFGVFVEHLGRCVYTGIYEPDHPTADADGFRQDVAGLTRELGATLVRYPGGNFMSGYDWEDGVGPHDQRPTRLDLAWFSTETNQVGTNEFMSWCKQQGMEPMFGVNLGTRGADEARQYLEYCNHPGGTTRSELRRSHGVDAPHAIKLWCLGNEMDGPWQICRKTPDEYGRLALETGKLMKMVDASIELAACGSSAYDMPSYGVWEDRVLEHCFEVVDYLSLHSYFVKPPNDPSTASFFAQIESNARYIEATVAVVDAVAARRHSAKRIMLSFDEWNVWYRARHGEHMKQEGWPQAPSLLEEVYNVEDALLIGGMLTMMINHADRVKVACLAQLVNVIGPIMTAPGGPAWRQTIFHPFALTARHAHGMVLRAVIRSPGWTDAKQGELPYLCASVVHEAASGKTAIFLLNRNLEQEMALTVNLRGLGGEQRLIEAQQLQHADLQACNTEAEPDKVRPAPLAGIVIEGETLRVRLQAASWNVIVTKAIASS